jgi:hypothetical protein
MTNEISISSKNSNLTEITMIVQVRKTAIDTAKAKAVDMKLEVVVIPVSDVDRAKHFIPTSAGDSMPTSPPATTGA